MKMTIIHQRYKPKTPTQIQQELRKLGVNGFVVKAAGRLVSENDIKNNRECLRNGKD